MKRVALALAILMAGLGVVHAQVGGKRVKLAPFPEPAEELYGVAAGGKLYVFGGLAPGWVPRGLVFEYDPAADRWTRKQPMALASHHVAVTELGGKIYAFGGFVPPAAGPAAWVPIANTWEYDPAADTWTARAPMPTRRGSPVAAVGGKVYVIGGASTHPGSMEPAIHPAHPHRALDTVEEYDPAADQWGALKARMPSPRSAVAWGVHGGRIYVAGGESQDSRVMAAFRALEAYEPGANRWIALPQMPIPRHGLAGAVLGNRLHLVSGDVQSAGIAGMHLHSDAHDAFEPEGQ